MQFVISCREHPLIIQRAQQEWARVYGSARGDGKKVISNVRARQPLMRASAGESGWIQKRRLAVEGAVAGAAAGLPLADLPAEEALAQAAQDTWTERQERELQFSRAKAGKRRLELCVRGALLPNDSSAALKQRAAEVQDAQPGRYEQYFRKAQAVKDAVGGTRPAALAMPSGHWGRRWMHSQRLTQSLSLIHLSY